MKHNVRRLLAPATVLAMLLSLFAVAEDGMTEMGMDQPIEIEGGTGNNGDTQGQEGELEFDMDEGEGLDGVALDEDAALDGDAALTLDAQIDLQAGALVFGSEETDSVTEEAAMDGDHTHDGQTFKEPLINSAAHLAVPFPPCISCRFFDLPPVNLQNLQERLTENSLAS